MTGNSLHMQWPLTSLLNGSFLKEKKWSQVNTLVKQFLKQSIISVALEGSSDKHRGNIVASNPVTGRIGPVCDDNWSIENVGTFFSAVSLLIGKLCLNQSTF
jgi:hypothetical protein